MKQFKYSRENCQFLWIVGCIERLSSLGMITAIGFPTVSPEVIDEYIRVDDHRNEIFRGPDEVMSILRAFLRCENQQQFDESLIEDISYLVLDYFNKRHKIVSYALNHSFQK